MEPVTAWLSLVELLHSCASLADAVVWIMCAYYGWRVWSARPSYGKNPLRKQPK